ncbi:MAG: radical SAM protein [Nitrospinae bacterium CG11_big_fil_rev_8_21_14_0_20_45_15]|nr:MAG: radical SAM protein [Nitrospinae bacterium CG11_big_fil_rev_8_21_14_0_20_45_15]
MKILQVIHGYPMRYNAGSEVYTQTLCHALAKHHKVHIFTREEDSFAPDYQLRQETDSDEPCITLHIVNNPRLKDRYRATGIDRRFAEVLEEVEPDIVHVGHLNHLSTSLLREAAARQIPIVFTLHDYWLMCPRGQFMQMFPEDGQTLWSACDGQDDRKCAERCYARYFGGNPEDHEADIAYWSDWVSRRMNHIREMAELVDLFIAPSRYLHDRFRDDFGLPARKLVVLDYGFARDKMTGRYRSIGESFTFGYIGTHIPAKGIHDLITAFGQLVGTPRLRIWGRPKGQDTESLRKLAARLPSGIVERIDWLSEYHNANIVEDVFNRVDAIVVPSIWVENSPLVIHEAQQARVPVITADAGGMAEYVHHNVNGLLFKHRSPSGLAEQMQRFVDNPAFARQLGNHGYLHDENGDVPEIQSHAKQIEALYKQVIRRQASSRVTVAPGPWRITFDTNPDTCNLHCIMCEEHSPHSTLQKTRRDQGRPPRIMPFEIIERVVAEAAPHGLREIIPSTMGEPLLYDRFEDIIDLCRRYDVKLNLTTNGTFPRLGAKSWAERIVPVASDVKISWNGSTKSTHERIMQGNRWEDDINNLRTFIAVRDRFASNNENRCQVTLQLTFLEENLDEVPDIVKLATELGVDRVKGHHLWAHFPEITEQSMRRNPSAIARWNATVEASRQVAKSRRLPNGQHVQLNNFLLLEDGANEDLIPGGPCPFLGQEAWVDTEGRFNPCCAPDQQRRSLGEFGNLHDRSLIGIWTSTEYRDLLTTYRTRTLCLSCNMRRPAAEDNQ